MSEDRSRRAFLASLSAVGTASLAGCTGERPPMEPQLPRRALEEGGWEHADRIDERTRETVELAGIERNVEFQIRGDVYENPRPAERVRRQFNVDAPPFEPPPAQFMPMKVDMDPSLHRLSGISNRLNQRLLNQLDERLMDQLREDGFQDVRRVSEGDLDIRHAGTAVHRRYRASYQYDRQRTEVQGQPVTVEPGTFDIEAQLAVWPYEGLLAVAGGAYPGESGVLDVTVSGETRELELGLQYREYRRSVRELITLLR